MKIFLVVIILVCFTLLGYGMSKYYVERKKFFSEFELFLTNLNSNINFARDRIFDIVNKYNLHYKSYTMNKLCENYKNILKQKKYVDKELFNEITILKKEEVELLQNFFCTLGKFDVYNQTKELNLYSMKFNELYKVANEECKKYASLVTKLALIVGLLVCLLII